MPNLSSLLKAEISRISRKEIKASVKSVKNSNADLKKNIADLKKRVLALESQIKKLQPLFPAQEKADVSPEAMEKASFSSRNIKALRTRLGISQGDFAKLLGVSSQAVYMMENKGGKLRLRQNTIKKLLAIKDIGRKEAKRMLEESK